ncbi:MAG: hypothetical protein RBS16_03240 [Candidatus Cloacimonadales bacterium]|jgi:hypothetical protein|nr:hypothetical protein [Candidatus Cloacimonadota bacterium]MDD2649987.1 hypothetical protein [Candidatus Cloacimonadota bacterium]MDD3501500.1 hypothetical protein [Candidatus Cloacimonadota bacterium]MDX9977029.1 hypothetical protein [Candidatus Cloacimonadales bacterium]
MAVNPNDNRFFITLGNYLKRNDIEFEVIEKPEIEYNGHTYNTVTEQFGVVEHNKENLTTAFEQTLAMFNKSYEKLFLYKFYFDEIDAETNIGQYTLLYILIEEHNYDLVDETEIGEDSDEEEMLLEFNEEDYQEDNIQEENELTDLPVLDKADFEHETTEEVPEEYGQNIVHQESKNDQLPSNNDIDKDNIPSEDHIKKHSFASHVENETFLAMQKDIEFLLKLLAKNINTEISEVLSKAILIVVKNHLNMS